MGILLTGFTLYVASFATQVILFRLRLPKNQILAILVIYPMILMLFLLLRFLNLIDPSSFLHLSLIECLYLSLAYIAVLPNYAILYGLIEAESPSSLMVLLLDSAGEKGLSRNSFNNLLTNDLFLWHRVAALEVGGYLIKKNDRYYITPKGTYYMHFWLVPRYLMGRKTYGG